MRTMITHLTQVVRYFAVAIVVLFLATYSRAETAQDRQVLIRDITTIAGVRENPLIGYGVVVGLKRTGDSQ